MSDLDVRLVKGKDPQLRSEIQNVLRRFNEEASDVRGPEPQPLYIRATDSGGNFVGGLVGDTYWSWLVIDVLAVVPNFRGSGLGSRLVELAETTARERGCAQVHTTAWAFQGLEFWRKMGYQVVGELMDYPKGHTLYWMHRELTS